MRKGKTISLLLSLSLLCTALIPGKMTYAATGDDSTDNGMVINKTATANVDGSYTIQLEAYATGSKVITEVTKEIPTDIVLVLDQSGSMANPIGTVSFVPYEDDTRNQDYYDVRANGGKDNLYYLLEDGSYASVSVTCQPKVTYTEIINGYNNSTFNEYTNYWANRENLYAKVNGEYLKVSVARTNRYGIYTYSLPDGTVIGSANGQYGSPSFSGIDGDNLYLATANDADNVYTYTYTDADGNVQTIGTSTGADTVFEETLYQKVVDETAGGTRLSALQTAVTTFADSVKTKAAGEDGTFGTEDDVNHRIAVVGFATGKYSNNSDYPTYENTELFIGSTQYNYNVNASSHYNSAFQDMNTQTGYNNVIASKNALAARGATYVDYGMNMANGIFDANPVPTGEKRNRVIVVFTDGQPGYSSYDPDVATAAIDEGDKAKTAGVTIYTVGIFSGANANTAGDENGTDTEKANWFMQNLSSNNGTPQNPSYYLSASDAKTLNSIFQQISDQIETGGSSTTLSEETVIKDIISPAFTLPEGTTADNITLETYHCTGKDGDEYTWSKNVDAMGARAVIENGQVSVTGFDFAENYVGTVSEGGNTTYRGDKLVIKFKVEPKAGFLGGNNVYTNSNAGVYKNSEATEPVLTFNQPQVNVPINDVTVNSQDKNVYLLGDVTAAQLQDGASVSVGDVSLDLNLENYGLEDWQTEYVDITVAITDASGNTIISLDDLTDDTFYSVVVTVTPKSNGEGANGTPAVEKSGQKTASVNVFKPELTFADSTVYYGDNAPTDYSSNLTSTVWKHESTTDAQVSMLGETPDLDIECTPESGIVDGKVNSKNDIKVNTSVEIDNVDVSYYTLFAHTNCSDNCSWSETSPDGTPAFLLHVKTCKLNITKAGGTAGEPYVFSVLKDGEAYSEVTVVGNATVTICELPVGTYSIEEKGDWSWRYSATCSIDAVLSSVNSEGSITCTNTLNNNNWLNGYSDVVTNIAGQEHRN